MAILAWNHAIPSTRFSYDPKDRTFSAERSDLNVSTTFGRIYDDAADLGFAMRSSRTGRVVLFALTREERDADGDARFWEFEPIPEHAPHAGDTRVIVFND